MQVRKSFLKKTKTKKKKKRKKYKRKTKMIGTRVREASEIDMDELLKRKKPSRFNKKEKDALLYWQSKISRQEKYRLLLLPYFAIYLSAFNVWRAREGKPPIHYFELENLELRDVFPSVKEAYKFLQHFTTLKIRALYPSTKLFILFQRLATAHMRKYKRTPKSFKYIEQGGYKGG